MTLPADWAYLAARIVAIVFLIAVIVIQVTLPRTKSGVPYRQVIQFSGVAALMAGFLFGQVGRDADPWAYVWFSFLMMFLGFIVVRSYSAARALTDTPPPAMETPA